MRKKESTAPPSAAEAPAARRSKVNALLGRPTISQIAEVCNLSKSTVSRVLNKKFGQFPITQHTIDMVHRKADELGYRPNRLAQALADNRTFLVGLYLPSLPHPTETGSLESPQAITPLSFEIFQGILGHPLFQKFDLVLHISPGENPTDSGARQPSEDLLEGLIVVNPAGSQRKQIESLATRMPVVMVGRFFEDSSIVSCLDPDNEAEPRTLIKACVAQGIRKFIYLSEECIEHYACIALRRRGFDLAVAGTGSTGSHIALKSGATAGLADLLKQALTDSGPAAVYAVTRELADRVHPILNRGDAAFSGVRLLHENVPLHDLCRAATQMLAEALESGDKPVPGFHLFGGQKTDQPTKASGSAKRPRSSRR